MTSVIKLPDPAATARLGAALGHVLRSGDCIALHGGLGAGKTTLARGLIGALCGAGTEVPSPTYTLVQTYNLPGFTLWHFDLYRLKTPDEVFELGWDEAADGVMLVEWPGNAGPHLPRQRLDLTLEIDADERRARLEPEGEDWQTRLDGFQY